jgi:hypothetical protein
MEPTFEIPAADAVVFATLPVAEQERVLLLLRSLKEIHVSKSKTSTAYIIARNNEGRRGFSTNRLMEYYRRYTATRSWSVILLRTLALTRTPIHVLPAEFIAYWKTLVASRGGSVTAAHRSLLGVWAAGGIIPGYGTWEQHYAHEFPGREVPTRWLSGFVPRGWSLNSLRRHQPTVVQRAFRQSLN